MSKSDFPLVGIALDTPVKAKKNRTRNLKIAKAKIKRVVEKSPEVMVKVTGSAKGAKHLKQHLDYISRNGKIELENERGELIDTRERLREEHKEWASDLGRARNNHIEPRKNERDSINIVLSMPVGTDPEAVRHAARNFAKEQFGETNQYVMALHHKDNDPTGNTKQPHVHLTVKALGYDGKKLNPKKADLQEWREAFAEKMREQGCNAEATPRRSRGVIEKGKKHIVSSIENDKDRPGRGRISAEKIKEAANDIAGKPVSKNPHREQIVETQNKIRKAWMQGAEQLGSSEDKEDQELAAKIRQFVSEMPRKLMDERERIKTELLRQVDAGKRHKEADKNTNETEKKNDQGLER